MKNFSNVSQPDEYNRKLAQLALINEAVLAFRSIVPMPPMGPPVASGDRSELLLANVTKELQRLHAVITNEVMDLHESYINELGKNFEQVLSETRVPEPAFAFPAVSPPPAPNFALPDSTPHPYPPPPTPAPVATRTVPRMPEAKPLTLQEAKARDAEIARQAVAAVEADLQKSV